VSHPLKLPSPEGVVAHHPLLVSENWSDCPFVWYQNIRSALFGFVTSHACDRQTARLADGQTDRITTASTALLLSQFSSSVRPSVCLVI